MRYLIALVILVAANEITASSYETTTEMELHDGNQAKLYWRQVYEGFTTLYKMEIGIIEINLTEHNAIGQPVFDPTNRFIALPYCADDGCQNTVNVFDLKKLIFLSPITAVPLTFTAKPSAEYRAVASPVDPLEAAPSSLVFRIG